MERELEESIRKVHEDLCRAWLAIRHKPEPGELDEVGNPTEEEWEEFIQWARAKKGASSESGS